MNAEVKLYAAVGVLAVLGGALFLTTKKQKEEAATYTLSGQAKELPKLAITDDDVKAIDKIVLTKAGDEDGGAGHAVELTKKGDDWRVSSPVDAAANGSNVKSMLDNLKTLKVAELIDGSKASYDKYKVADNKGLHAVFTKGGATVLDAWFGENGSRGQMSRIAGKDGVYTIKGYSSYLYDRETKAWRDQTLFKFEDTSVTRSRINGNARMGSMRTGSSGRSDIRVMHIRRGLPLISAEHDPHLPALQFQRTARSLAVSAWILCTASSTTIPGAISVR